MGQSRRVFTPKFKEEALKLVTVGRYPTAQVARDLGITLNLLRRWKQEITGHPIPAFPGKKRRKPHEEELARLTQKLARVTQERDFLKGMAGLARPVREDLACSIHRIKRLMQSDTGGRSTNAVRADCAQPDVRRRLGEPQMGRRLYLPLDRRRLEVWRRDCRSLLARGVGSPSVPR